MNIKRMPIWDERNGDKYLSTAAREELATHGVTMPCVGRSLVLQDDTGLQCQVEIFGREPNRIALVPHDAPEWAEDATKQLT